ncbi:MAG: hypothetical protein HPY69_04060 [Armatimonadetes bacterium]|nr:hypothetical protein [Armatimonadota bacterium]
MAFASFLLGTISLVGVAITVIPLLGWLNWLILPLAVAGLLLGILSAYASAHREHSSCLATLGIILNCVALGLGILRLMIGGGVI